MVFIIKTCVLVYKKTISPFLGPVCCFAPSCSNNMILCLERFGFVIGLYFGLLQVFRCHPWSFLQKQKGINYNG